MGAIPLGNFGGVVAAPQQAVGTPAAATGATQARALGELAQTAGSIATQAIERKRVEQEEADENEALNAAMDYEIGMKEASANLAGRLERGEVKAEEVPNLWREAQSEVHMSTIGKLRGGRAAEAAYRRSKSVNATTSQFVQGAVEGQVQQRFAADAVGALDRLGKLALMPGESLEGAITQGDSIFPELARRGGISEARATQQLQTWKDDLRYQRAKLDLNGVRHDVAGLDKFTERLQNGDLVGKLDADKVTALIKDADSYRWQLQQGAEHAAEKREKVAERAVLEAERQIEQGVPLNVAGWDKLREKTAGTESAPDFNRLVLQERETQQVLRLPIDQQQAYVQQREAQLMQNGGTLADRGNLQRIRATVEYNTKQLQNDPLVAAQRLYGRAVKPIDWADIATPLGPERAAEAFNDRAATLAAMRKQFGPSVGLKPLMPQEVRLLTKVLDDASPQTAVSLFGSLRWAIGSDDVYQAAMGQIAQDSPVKAHAGLFAAVNVPITLDRNRLSADVRTSSVKVAQTMLMGEGIINRTKAQKSQDGKDASLAAPARSAFDADFAEHVGALYRGRPEAQQADLQAAFAYYVGRAAEKGRLATSPQDIDPKLVRESIAATIGDVVNVNGFGEAKAPIGMSGDKFEKKAEQAFIEEIRTRGLPPEWAEHWSGFGLMNWRQDGTYLLTVGVNPVIDPKTREPIVLDLVWRGATGRKFGRQPWEHPPAYVGPPIPEGSR